MSSITSQNAQIPEKKQSNSGSYWHNSGPSEENPRDKMVFEQALQYIKESAESGVTQALTDLGNIYELGGIKD